MKMKPRTTPRVTFSALCEFLSASPTRQISIIREQKAPKPAKIKSYTTAVQQIQDFAVNKKPLNPLAAGLEPHEQEVIEELLNNNWTPPSKTVHRPATKQPPMKVNGVEISVFPDLLLAENTAKRSMTGSMKFYCTKSRELKAEVGRWMASLLYCYSQTVLNDTDAHPDLCMIYDVREDEYYEAGKSYKRLYQNVESACQIIASLWPTV